MNSMNRHTNRFGFTLTELIVGLAIFSTIMAGVTIMFNSAVRTTKQGYQNQRAFENVRGAFTLIEEDLTRAFGSKNTGLEHTFYGAPFGFSFIGLVQTEGTTQFNTARITYVVYGQEDSENELTRVYNTTASDDDESKEIITYSLIRYVEPGQDDLESFPIDWASTTTFYDSVDPTTFTAIMASAIRDSATNSLCFTDENLGAMSDADAVAFAQGNPCFEGVVNATKRELWLRMLADDPMLPNFWDVNDGEPVMRIGTTQADTLLPADYIVAENLLHIDRSVGFSREDPDLQLNYEVQEWVPGFVPFGDGPDVFIDTNKYDDHYDMALIDFEGSSTEYILFSEWYDDEVQPGTVIYSPTNYFFGYREYDSETRRPATGDTDYARQVDDLGNFVLNDPQDSAGFVSLAGTDYLAESVATARLFGFWNDTRNLEWNRYVNAEYINSSFILQMQIEELSTVPDIINPSLPESMLIEFAVFYPSPYPGAPDFQKVFSHRVDLPSAHRRKKETQWTKVVRDTVE